MLKPYFELKTAVTRRIAAGLEKLEPALQKVAARRTAPARNQLLQELQTQPGPPKYPLKWQSERQRRAFFATDGFGHGIPYRRTGRLSAGWKVTAVFERDGGVIKATNDTPYAEYVQGVMAQDMHIITGWPQAPGLLIQYQDVFANNVVQSWYEVIDTLMGGS